MVAEMIDVHLDAAKFFSGDRFRVSFSAVLQPGAEELVPELTIDLFVFGSFQGKRGAFGLGDLFFHDKTTGTYKKTVILDGVPMGDVGILLVGKFRGAEESSRTYVVSKHGQLVGERAVDLTGEILLVSPKFKSDIKTLVIKDEKLRFDEEAGKVIGDFDIYSELYRVDQVFLRLGRRDISDSERCVDIVNFSKDENPAHVQFVDESFVNRTSGVWGYKGTASVRDKEREFLNGFIDKMSWEILSLKEIYDKIEAAKEWDMVTLIWNKEKSSFSDKYNAIRTASLNILSTFEQYFGTLAEIDKARALLGESVVFREALDMFFDFCFLLLESCEGRMESIGAFDLLPIELKQTLDATIAKGYRK